METTTPSPKPSNDTLCTQELLQRIVPSDVMKVYVGKPGCMCGCNGTYKVHPLHLAEASLERGYAYEQSDVDEAAVTRVLRLLQADPRTCIDFGNILYIPPQQLKRGEKNLAVYLCKSSVI